MPGPLQLEITWHRDGKVQERQAWVWYPQGEAGRFVCGFCGEQMTGKKLRGHWFKCAVEFGELGDE
jgi:hypothetical protein